MVISSLDWSSRAMKFYFSFYFLLCVLIHSDSRLHELSQLLLSHLLLHSVWCPEYLVHSRQASSQVSLVVVTDSSLVMVMDMTVLLL